MDSSGQELHPNWRALATCHIKLKRFVPAGTVVEAAETNREYNNKLENVNGQEIQHFYEQLVQQPATTATTTKTTNSCADKVVKHSSLPKKVKFSAKAFFHAATHNDIETIKNMEINEQQVNLRDEYTWTALMMAACAGAQQVVEFLLDLGADVKCTEKSGKTAADLAKKNSYFHIVEILQNHTLNAQNTVIAEELAEEIEPFYCESCQQVFKETNKNKHLTSTLHKFCNDASCNTNRLQKFNISERNRGLQLMLKQGWDREHGLGPTNSGRLYPIKTVIRKQRTGLGVEQPAARVTHFKAFDLSATKSNKYKQRSRNRNDIKREAVREWKKNRRLHKELS